MSITFEGDKEFIDRLAEIVLAHLGDENFGVNQLVKETGLSTSVVRRMLKTISKKTINQFINEVRLTKALEILQLGSVTASEVAYKVGFSSPAYFNTCFHDYFGYSPGEAKQRRIIEAKEESAEPNSMSGRDEEIPKNFQEQQTTQKKRKLKTIIYASGGILVITLLAWFFVYPLIKNSAFRLKPEDKSIAVLPFKNLSNDEENQAISEGLTRNISDKLPKDIKVVTARQFKELNESPLNKQKIANMLGVRFLLTGSVQHSGDSILIIVQLSDTKSKRVQIISSDKYKKEFNISLVQNDITMKVARKFKTVLSPEEIKKIEKIPTTNNEAYKLYVDGRYYYYVNVPDRKLSLEKSIECFNQAIALDPDFSLAYAMLAGAYYRSSLYGWYPRAEAISKSREYTEKALSIDSDLSGAHVMLGLFAFAVDWNWKEAEKEISLAIELDPNNDRALMIYAQYLDIIGKMDDARRHIDRALELNPLDPLFHWLSWFFYYRQGNYDEALQSINKRRELLPNKTYWEEWTIYYKQGKDLKAIEAIQKVPEVKVELEKNSVSLMQIYEESEMEGIIRWKINFLESQEKLAHYALAVDYARLYDKDAALKHLESAFETQQSDLPRIKFDPELEILRTEPRFIALLEKMNLGGYESEE